MISRHPIRFGRPVTYHTINRSIFPHENFENGRRREPRQACRRPRGFPRSILPGRA